MRRSVLCLLLVCASAIASAREARLQGAGGNGDSCPEIAAAVDEAEASTPSTKSRPAAANTGRGKAAAKPRGSDGQRVQAPRWHSFLPGMFR